MGARPAGRPPLLRLGDSAVPPTAPEEGGGEGAPGQRADRDQVRDERVAARVLPPDSLQERRGHILHGEAAAAPEHRHAAAQGVQPPVPLPSGKAVQVDIRLTLG